MHTCTHMLTHLHAYTHTHARTLLHTRGATCSGEGRPTNAWPPPPPRPLLRSPRRRRGQESAEHNLRLSSLSLTENQADERARPARPSPRFQDRPRQARVSCQVARAASMQAGAVPRAIGLGTPGMSECPVTQTLAPSGPAAGGPGRPGEPPLTSRKSRARAAGRVLPADWGGRGRPVSGPARATSPRPCSDLRHTHRTSARGPLDSQRCWRPRPWVLGPLDTASPRHTRANRQGRRGSEPPSPADARGLKSGSRRGWGELTPRPCRRRGRWRDTGPAPQPDRL